MKSDLPLAAALIAVYLTGLAAAETAGAGLLFRAAFLTAVVLFIWKSNAWEAHGLVRGRGPFSLYLPLAALATVDLWYGLCEPPADLLPELAALVLAGVTEEILFRGFLFRALCEMFSTASAVWISAAVFALFHFLPLFDGADAALALSQTGAALAAGVLFAVLLIRTGSLMPAIFTHCLLNALSLWGDPMPPALWRAGATAGWMVIALGFAAFLWKNGKWKMENGK